MKRRQRLARDAHEDYAIGYQIKQRQQLHSRPAGQKNPGTGTLRRNWDLNEELERRNEAGALLVERGTRRSEVGKKQKLGGGWKSGWVPSAHGSKEKNC
jgi:hypothetical protein